MVSATHSGYSPISIKIEDLWVIKGGGLFSSRKAILQDVSFEVEAGHFVAIVGPNGAGKTTLLRAIVGEQPARGQILFFKDDGSQEAYESLYDNPEYWLQQIGYIPVDNVLHDDLTVRQALMHIGRLRLPEQSDDEIAAKMHTKLDKLGFSLDDPRLNQQVKTLSSGERKKINIAAELLTDPPLLMLDEPTSNLDPNAERDLMDNLRDIAGVHNQGDGPTILLVTHTLSTLDRCDEVIFIENSCLTDYGSENAVFARLEQEAANVVGLESILQSPSRFEHWAEIFEVFKTEEERANRDRVPPAPQKYPKASRRARPQDSFWRQFRILSTRYFLMRYNDLSGIVVMLLSGFIAGFLLLIAPEEIFLEAQDASGARQTVVLYIILIVIIGAFNSHREISKEFRIYLHERTKGLMPLPYIMSKVVWLSLILGLLTTMIILALTGMPLARYIALVLGILVLLLGIWSTFISDSLLRKMPVSRKMGRMLQIGLIALPLIAAFFVQFQNKELPDYPLEPTVVEILVDITFVLTAVAALVLGILISALVGGNNDRATQFAIAVIIVNVVLAFSVLVVGTKEFQGLFDTLEPFAASYWGYSGFSSSLSIYCWAGQPRFENFNSWGYIGSTWLLLLVHIIVSIGLAVFALRMQETWTTRWRLLRETMLNNRQVLIFGVLVLSLLSWSVFLNHRSHDYFELTFYDRLFGGTRYAHVDAIDNVDWVQKLNGSLSESQCGKP